MLAVNEIGRGAVEHDHLHLAANEPLDLVSRLGYLDPAVLIVAARKNGVKAPVRLKVN